MIPFVTSQFLRLKHFYLLFFLKIYILRQMNLFGEFMRIIPNLFNFFTLNDQYCIKCFAIPFELNLFMVVGSLFSLLKHDRQLSDKCF